MDATTTSSGSGFLVITTIASTGIDDSGIYASVFSFHNWLVKQKLPIPAGEWVTSGTQPAPKPIGQAKVTATALRVRQTPSTSGSTTRFVTLGTVLDIYGYLELPDGTKPWTCISQSSDEWVSSFYLAPV